MSSPFENKHSSNPFEFQGQSMLTFHEHLKKKNIKDSLFTPLKNLAAAPPKKEPSLNISKTSSDMVECLFSGDKPRRDSSSSIKQ